MQEEADERGEQRERMRETGTTSSNRPAEPAQR